MDELHELTAAYALDALEPAEERAYEAHLEECARCRDELAGLADTAAALAYAAGEASPPEALRGRILDAARAERTNVVPLRAAVGARPSRRSPAAAAVLVVGMGMWNVSLQHRLDRRSALAAVLGRPGCASASRCRSLPGSSSCRSAASRSSRTSRPRPTGRRTRRG